jgi:hypothetical protein
LCGFAADRRRESTLLGVDGVIDGGLSSVEVELGDLCSDECDCKKIVFRSWESEDS